MPVQVGDLVYVHVSSDGSKTHARNRYLVVSVDGLWCNIRKFNGSQLRSTSYRVKLSECYRVPDLTETMSNLSRRYSTDFYPEDIDEEPLTSAPLLPLLPFFCRLVPFCISLLSLVNKRLLLLGVSAPLIAACFTSFLFIDRY